MPIPTHSRGTYLPAYLESCRMNRFKRMPLARTRYFQCASSDVLSCLDRHAMPLDCEMCTIACLGNTEVHKTALLISQVSAPRLHETAKTCTIRLELYKIHHARYRSVS